MEYDERSPLMSENATRVYLGVDSKALTKLITSQRLKRDPITGSFARVQVYALANEIAKGLGYETHGTALGQQEPQMGSLDRQQWQGAPPRLV
jgi:hypothetical protein